jgi:zinc transport system substrate-binding protein
MQVWIMYSALKHVFPIFYMFLMLTTLPVVFAANASDHLMIATNSINTTQLSLISFNTNESRIKVVASFYPVYEFVKEIGGNKVDVTSLIPIGVEPHDFEPTIQQIQNAETADLVVYNGAGLEKWIDKINAKFKVEASQGLNLLMSNDTGNSGTYDLHVWLDPILAEMEVENIRDALVKIDPANTQYYKANADRFIGKLNDLDYRIKTELATCNKKDFIAFHNAFTYFANRYGLNQHSVHQGLTPEGEVLPQRLQGVIELARDLGLHIVYSEDLVDPRSSEVIAQEIPNGKVLILSPIEGINSEEQRAGIGYLDKMNENVENLKIGLECQLK